jgi:general secretion pathway protein A
VTRRKTVPRSNLKAFFGFTRHPFPPACSPEPLFRPASLDAAIEQAKGALANRLWVLVTAPAGFGKTSFLRILAAELNPRDLKVARLTGQGVGPMELVRKLAEELGIETSPRREQSVKLLAAGLKRLAVSGPLAVAMIDEAQNVSIEAINHLRLVAEETVPPALALVLVGDERFRATLTRQAHVPLYGRLAVRIALGPLSVDQTEAFVAHAFKSAGMQNILAPTAVAAVHAASSGAPREIGAVLSRGLSRAFEKQSRLLTDEIVQEVLDGNGR